MNASRERRTACLIIAAAVPVMIAATACGSQQPPGQGQAGRQDASVAAIQAAFSKAIEVHQSFGSPPAAYQQAALAAIHAGRPVPPISAALRSQLLASGKAEIARYFGSPQAATEYGDLAKAMRLDDTPGIVNLGSAVTKITFLNVTAATAATASATVHADVTVQATSAARQTATGPWLTSDPVNVMDYTATLRRISSGAWQVTKLVGDFVPGEGP